MALVFARKNARRRTSASRAAAQGVLWEPTVVGRSFAQNAMTFRSGDAVLKERLRELELKRRRAQISARRVVENRDEPRRVAQPGALPFAS